MPRLTREFGFDPPTDQVYGYELSVTAVRGSAAVRISSEYGQVRACFLRLVDGEEVELVEAIPLVQSILSRSVGRTADQTGRPMQEVVSEWDELFAELLHASVKLQERFDIHHIG